MLPKTLLGPLAVIGLLHGSPLTAQAPLGGERKNADVRLDFQPLHGVSTYFEERDGDYEYFHTVSYTVTPAPGGRATLVRSAAIVTRWRGTDMERMTRIASITSDLLEAEVSVSVTALRPEASSHAGSLSWKVVGAKATVDSGGVRTGSFPVSPGMIPLEIIGGVFAAMADSLAVPSQITLWVGDYVHRGQGFDEQSVAFDLLDVTSVEVRVPREAGETCQQSTRTKPTEFSTIRVRAAQADRVDHYRLESPHVRVDPDGICLSVP